MECSNFNDTVGQLEEREMQIRNELKPLFEKIKFGENDVDTLVDSDHDQQKQGDFVRTIDKTKELIEIRRKLKLSQSLKREYQQIFDQLQSLKDDLLNRTTNSSSYSELLDTSWYKIKDDSCRLGIQLRDVAVRQMKFVEESSVEFLQERLKPVLAPLERCKSNIMVGVARTEDAQQKQGVTSMMRPVSAMAGACLPSKNVPASRPYGGEHLDLGAEMSSDVSIAVETCNDEKDDPHILKFDRESSMIDPYVYRNKTIIDDVENVQLLDDKSDNVIPTESSRRLESSEDIEVVEIKNGRFEHDDAEPNKKEEDRKAKMKSKRSRRLTINVDNVPSNTNLVSNQPSGHVSSCNIRTENDGLTVPTNVSNPQVTLPAATNELNLQIETRDDTSNQSRDTDLPCITSRKKMKNEENDSPGDTETNHQDNTVLKPDPRPINGFKYCDNENVLKTASVDRNCCRQQSWSSNIQINRNDPLLLKSKKSEAPLLPSDLYDPTASLSEAQQDMKDEGGVSANSCVPSLINSYKDNTVMNLSSPRDDHHAEVAKCQNTLYTTSKDSSSEEKSPAAARTPTGATIISSDITNITTLDDNRPPPTYHVVVDQDAATVNTKITKTGVLITDIDDDFKSCGRFEVVDLNVMKYRSKEEMDCSERKTVLKTTEGGDGADAFFHKTIILTDDDLPYDNLNATNDDFDTILPKCEGYSSDDTANRKLDVVKLCEPKFITVPESRGSTVSFSESVYRIDSMMSNDLVHDDQTPVIKTLPGTSLYSISPAVKRNTKFCRFGSQHTSVTPRNNPPSILKKQTSMPETFDEREFSEPSSRTSRNSPIPSPPKNIRILRLDNSLEQKHLTGLRNDERTVVLGGSDEMLKSGANVKTMNVDRSPKAFFNAMTNGVYGKRPKMKRASMSCDETITHMRAKQANIEKVEPLSKDEMCETSMDSSRTTEPTKSQVRSLRWKLSKKSISLDREIIDPSQDNTTTDIALSSHDLDFSFQKEPKMKQSCSFTSLFKLNYISSKKKAIERKKQVEARFDVLFASHQEEMLKGSFLLTSPVLQGSVIPNVSDHFQEHQPKEQSIGTRMKPEKPTHLPLKTVNEVSPNDSPLNHQFKSPTISPSSKTPTPFEVFSKEDAFKRSQKEAGIGYEEKVQTYLQGQSLTKLNHISPTTPVNKNSFVFESIEDSKTYLKATTSNTAESEEPTTDKLFDYDYITTEKGEETPFSNNTTVTALNSRKAAVNNRRNSTTSRMSSSRKARIRIRSRESSIQSRTSYNDLNMSTTNRSGVIEKNDSILSDGGSMSPLLFLKALEDLVKDAEIDLVDEVDLVQSVNTFNGTYSRNSPNVILHHTASGRGYGENAAHGDLWHSDQYESVNQGDYHHGLNYSSHNNPMYYDEHPPDLIETHFKDFIDVPLNAKVATSKPTTYYKSFLPSSLSNLNLADRYDGDIPMDRAYGRGSSCAPQMRHHFHQNHSGMRAVSVDNTHIYPMSGNINRNITDVHDNFRPLGPTLPNNNRSDPLNCYEDVWPASRHHNGFCRLANSSTVSIDGSQQHSDNHSNTYQSEVNDDHPFNVNPNIDSFPKASNSAAYSYTQNTKSKSVTFSNNFLLSTHDPPKQHNARNQLSEYTRRRMEERNATMRASNCATSPREDYNAPSPRVMGHALTSGGPEQTPLPGQPGLIVPPHQQAEDESEKIWNDYNIISKKHGYRHNRQDRIKSNPRQNDSVNSNLNANVRRSRIDGQSGTSTAVRGGNDVQGNNGSSRRRYESLSSEHPPANTSSTGNHVDQQQRQHPKRFASCHEP